MNNLIVSHLWYNSHTLHTVKHHHRPEENNTPGVENHGQCHSGDSFSSSHARARDGGAFGFQLHSEGFCDAAQEHVEDAQFIPVTLLCGVDDVTDVCWRQSLHPNNAGESHRCHLWKDPSKE